MTDLINHPPHYTAHPSGVECIRITEHMGFNLGNAVKYIWRADLKSDSPLDDLRKAAWYVQREIERRLRAVGGEYAYPERSAPAPCEHLIRNADGTCPRCGVAHGWLGGDGPSPLCGRLDCGHRSRDHLPVTGPAPCTVPECGCAAFQPPFPPSGQHKLGCFAEHDPRISFCPVEHARPERHDHKPDQRCDPGCPGYPSATPLEIR